MRARWVLQEDVGQGRVMAGQDNRRAGKASRRPASGPGVPGSWGGAGRPEAAGPAYSWGLVDLRRAFPADVFLLAEDGLPAQPPGCSGDLSWGAEHRL